jgi:hypothetical protein
LIGGGVGQQIMSAMGMLPSGGGGMVGAIKNAMANKS